MRIKKQVAVFLLAGICATILGSSQKIEIASAQATGACLFTQISGGDDHSLGLKDDGTVWAWGRNERQTIGDATVWTRSETPVQVSGLTNVTEIDAGISAYDFSYAVKNDGTVWYWSGSGTAGGVNQISGLNNIVHISSNNYQGVAVDSNGTVWEWDSVGLISNVRARTDIPVNITEVSHGYHFSLALDENGNVWGWGFDGQGQVGDNGTATLVLNYAETAVKVVVNPALPVNDPARYLSGVSKISAGYNDSYAIVNAGEIWTWGGFIGNTIQPTRIFNTISNAAEIEAAESYGGTGSDSFELGMFLTSTGLISTFTHEGTLSTYTVVETTFNVTKISKGFDHFMTLADNNSIYSWGNNTYGQLGNGTTTLSNEPVEINLACTMSPSSGPAAGGTTVTIQGSNFQSGATVSFGGSSATSVNWVDSNTITAVSPAGTGTVDVSVQNPLATSPTILPNAFTYIGTGGGGGGGGTGNVVEIHLSSLTGADAAGTTTGIANGCDSIGRKDSCLITRATGEYINSLGSPYIIDPSPTAVGYSFNVDGLVSEDTGVTYGPETLTAAAQDVVGSDNLPIVVSDGDETLSKSITLPFHIQLFGAEVNQIAVANNGFVAVHSVLDDATWDPDTLPTGCCSGQSMQTTGMTHSDFMIAGAWTDLAAGIQSNGNPATIKTETFGSAPNRIFVVDYNNIPDFDNGNTNMSFQIKFMENTGGGGTCTGGGGSNSVCGTANLACPTLVNSFGTGLEAPSNFQIGLTGARSVESTNDYLPLKKMTNGAYFDDDGDTFFEEAETFAFTSNTPYSCGSTNNAVQLTVSATPFLNATSKPLISYGADGLPTGTGANEDYYAVFSVMTGADVTCSTGCTLARDAIESNNGIKYGDKNRFANPTGSALHSEYDPNAILVDNFNNLNTVTLYSNSQGFEGKISISGLDFALALPANVVVGPAGSGTYTSSVTYTLSS